MQAYYEIAYSTTRRCCSVLHECVRIKDMYTKIHLRAHMHTYAIAQLYVRIQHADQYVSTTPNRQECLKNRPGDSKHCHTSRLFAYIVRISEPQDQNAYFFN